MSLKKHRRAMEKKQEARFNSHEKKLEVEIITLKDTITILQQTIVNQKTKIIQLEKENIRLEIEVEYV